MSAEFHLINITVLIFMNFSWNAVDTKAMMTSQFKFCTEELRISQTMCGKDSTCGKEQAEKEVLPHCAKNTAKRWWIHISWSSLIPVIEHARLRSCAVWWKYTHTWSFVISDRHSRGNNMCPLKYPNFEQLERQKCCFNHASWVV